VKRSGEREKASVRWHAVHDEKHNRADGRVRAMLPEFGVFRKRPKRDGHDQYSPSHTTTLQVPDLQKDV
jgi:hypothetical protein